MSLCIAPSAAHATYSIAAVDMSTQEVGGAITSCVGSLDVGIVYGALPGVGVIHAQAQLDQRGRAKTRALELLMQGMAPKEIIVEITDPGFDPGSASRQYGLVDLKGQTAGYTGAQAQAYKRDQQGMNGAFAYSVQGNILTSQAVLDQATAAFEAPACDLAERLMRALEAGAEHGEGDSRCTGDGIPSDSAYIQVDRPGQSEPYLRLSIADTSPQSPLPLLRKQFDAWRATHPCPMANATAGAGGAMNGTAGSGGGAAAGSGGIAGGTPAAAASGGAGMGMSAAGSGAPARSDGKSAAGTGATASSSAAAGSGTAASLGVAAMGSAARGAMPGANSPSAGAAANTSGAATAASSATPASTTHGIGTAEPAPSSGCSLSPPARRSSCYGLFAASALWLAARARRRSAAR